MSNSNLITIGETAAVRDIVQAALGDFRWPIQFYEGETGEVPLDVSDDDFEFIIYDRDDTTALLTLEVGTGISFETDSMIQVDIAIEDYTDLTIGCKYKYLLRQTTGTFRKVLFTGKFTLVK
jgi:hypothetical protein